MDIFNRGHAVPSFLFFFATEHVKIEMLKTRAKTETYYIFNISFLTYFLGQIVLQKSYTLTI